MVTDAGGVDSPVAERRSPGEPEAPVEPKRVETSNNGKTKKPTTGRLMRRVSSLAVSILARGLDVFDIFIKVLGPIFMLLALFLFSFETYTYFVHVLPSYGEDVPIILQASLTMLGVFLLFNLTFNYLKAIFTDPGLPPDWDGDTLVEAGKEDLKGSEEGAPRRRAKRCYKCKRQKPERSHHCSVCKRCVLKMDHHCPWINNCVGFNNYRYFCLFLLYLALCCLFVIIAFFDAFLNTMVSPRKSKLNFGARQCVSLSWIIAACILFALCLLGGFHVWLVLTNQTTIEFHTNISNKDKARRRGEFYRNPYDLGRPRNFKQVFGPHDFFTWRWALSYLSQPPVGDGITYPSTSYNFSKT